MEQSEAIIAVVILAGVAFVMSGQAPKSQKGLQIQNNDVEYENLCSAFQYLENQVGSKLTGLPGISIFTVSEIKNFLVDIRAFQSRFDKNSISTRDIVSGCERMYQRANSWVNRQDEIKAGQKANIRQMRAAGGRRIRNRPLGRMIQTQNDHFANQPYDQVNSGQQQMVTWPDPPPSNEIFQPGRDAGPMRDYVDGNLVFGAPNMSHVQISQDFLQIANPENDDVLMSATRDMQVGLIKPKEDYINMDFEYSPTGSEQMFSALDDIGRELAPSPNFGTTSTAAAGSIYGAGNNAPLAIRQKRPEPTEQKQQTQSTAIVPLSDFNQQGDFENPMDVTAEKIRREKAQAKKELEEGNMAQSHALASQAQIRQFGEVAPKSPVSKPTPLISRALVRAPQYNPVDIEEPPDENFYNAINKIQKKAEQTDRVSDLEVYINELYRTVPRKYAMNPLLFTNQPKPDIVHTEEHRTWTRILKYSVNRRNKERPRSGSFSSPGKAGAPRKRFRTPLDKTEEAVEMEQDSDPLDVQETTDFSEPAKGGGGLFGSFKNIWGN